MYAYQNIDFIRSDIKYQRNNLSSDEVMDIGLIISNRLISFIEDKNLYNIMVYFPFKNEVNITRFINFIIKKNKGAVFPRVLSNTEMGAYLVKDISELGNGYFGVLEPKLNICKEFDLKNINLVVAPGLIFDKHCNRIGMGKGFYDRFFNKMSNFNKKVLNIGVCYDFQIVNNLIVKPTDYPMDIVISESNIFFRKTIDGGII